MNAFSPIVAGFRLVFRRPAVALGEIAWRWCFAATAWALGGALVFEYFDTLPVNPAERLLLRTGQPFLVLRALRSIFSGSLFRFTEAAVLTGLGLALAWILLASLGRIVVVRSILGEMGLPQPSYANLGVLFSLNFLRTALFVATKLSALGALFATSSFWASTHIRAADAVRLAFLGWIVIGMLWAALNWLLATAASFSAADTQSAGRSIGQVLHVLERSPGPMLIAVLLFTILQGLGVAAVGGATLSLLAVAGAHLGGFLVLEFGLLLVYSAIADFLHATAVAAYLLILRGEEPSAATEPHSTTGPADGARTVDRDELILSDVPLLAT